MLSACTAEQRSTGPEQPQTPPNGPLDARIAFYDNNASQLAQGGRYFSWYGCNACHAEGVRGSLDLNDRQTHGGGNFDQVYIAIAGGHTAMKSSYRALIPTAQLWQITAFVRSLPGLTAGKRRRGDMDQVGEPQAKQWSGPIGIGVLAFGLWVHHMFAVGLPRLGNSFYTAASMAIALPAGLQIFCWIATMWSGRLRLATPMLWVLGFITTFVIGGLSGVMTASAPLDLQLHDTYFVVAHLHYVLVGGAMFPLFGAFCYWYPKATGRMMSERWGMISFALIVLGFNVGFFPMHLLGLEGMPRRIYTYGPEMGWGTLNLIASLGALISTVGGLVFVANAFWSARHGAMAGPDPWGGPTLEWATPSPPPPHNFDEVQVVDSIAPLWGEERQVLTGLSAEHREVLITSVIDALPQYRQKSPTPSLWPLIAAIATSVLFVGSIFTPWALVWGAVPVGVALTAWFWPERPREKVGLLGARH